MGCFDFPGQKSSCHDRAKRPRSGVPVRRSGLAVDRIEELGDASASVQLPLPRTQTRGDRRRRGLHPTRVEDVAKPAENLRAQRTFYIVFRVTFNSIPFRFVYNITTCATIV